MRWDLSSSLGCILFILVHPIAAVPALEPWLIVNRSGAQTSQSNLQVFTCQGLYSRNISTRVYVNSGGSDVWWLQATGGSGTILPPEKTVSESKFVQLCMAKFQKYIRYNATSQQSLLPLMATIAGVMDAVPLEDSAIQEFAGGAGASLAFDAIMTFAGLSDHDATAYVYDHWGNMTTGVAKLNPGWRWDSKIQDTFKPTLTGGAQTKLVDYIVKRRLFNFFLKDGCIPLTKEHTLMERMLADKNNWPRPIVVYGYDNTHPLFGGDLFEAESTCSREHNMGQVASEGVTNLAYFSSEPAVSQPLQQLPDPPIQYNASRTYIALIVGDGDNVQYIQGSRSSWMKERVGRCQAGGGAGNKTACFPLVWTVQANLLHMAPAWLRWFYKTGASTGADWFALPPSGDTYSYPSLLSAAEQSTFVSRTEHDCTMLNTSGSVSWEQAFTWKNAINNYYPRYAKAGVVRAFFPVNVPYPIPVFEFAKNENYKVLGGGETPTVLFRPQEWRGSTPSRCKTALSPLFGDGQCATVADMSARINSLPAGTSTHIYLTSDGGGRISTLYDLVAQLGEHVTVVNQNQLAEMALAHHKAAGYGDRGIIV